MMKNYTHAAYETLDLPSNERLNLVLASELRADYVSAMNAELVRKTFGEYNLPMNPSCGVLFSTSFSDLKTQLATYLSSIEAVRRKIANRSCSLIAMRRSIHVRSNACM